MLQEEKFKRIKEINKIYDSNNDTESIIKDFNILESSDDNLNLGVTKYSNEKFSLCSQDEQQRFLRMLASRVQLFICDGVKTHNGYTGDMADVYERVKDIKFKNIIKENRSLIYPTSRARQKGKDKDWMDWHGFQIIDLDIKDHDLSVTIKPMLFDNLKTQHWFIGITLSSSGTGIHIWTKVNPSSFTFQNRIKEYRVNFRHKFSFVYCCLEKILHLIRSDNVLSERFKEKISDDKMLNWIDKAMCKITQGAFIPYDDSAELNTNFRDLPLDVSLDSKFWSSNKVLNELFERFSYFTSEYNEKENIDESDIEFDKDLIPFKRIKSKHYKYSQRYRLANTLCKLYGGPEALKILNIMCGKWTSYRELSGIVNTAISLDKDMDKWAIDELNKEHGFNINIKYNISVEKLISDTESKETPISRFEDENVVKFNITAQQYLSDIKDQILKECSNLTLIEAGAGIGKTEMIKSMSGRILMVLPFTSIIQSKIELDNSLGDNWLSFYSSKTPTPEDFISGKNMVMTIDKFSRLSLAELEINDFSYIVIDESHLMFISGYRDVMASALQLIANVYKKVPVLLFTGTPTGETKFFENIKHIKVIKEDYREKNVTFFMCYKEEEQIYEMCKHMAESIEQGKHILFPTNSGQDYFNKICKIVQQILVENNSEIALKTFYYKKSNAGKTDMNTINRDKSIGDNHIIGCTTYLSVGVDICDRYDFEVFFDTRWIPQEIEQFANRIRNNNLNINIYLREFDSTGGMIDYSATHKLNFTLNPDEQIDMHNSVAFANNSIKTGGINKVFNPLIYNITNVNYIKFDPINNEWYIDKIGYRLDKFETCLRKYLIQLPILESGLEYYRYKTKIVELSKRLTEDRRNLFKEMVREIKLNIISSTTVETFKWLESLTEESFELFKDAASKIEYLNSENFKEYCSDHNLFLPSNNEIILNNIPYIKTFSKWYDFDTIQEIYQSCASKNCTKINYSSLNRIRDFIMLEDQRIKMNLDLPFYKLIKESYDWFVSNSEVSENIYETKKAELLAKYVNSVDNLCIAENEVSSGKTFCQKISKLFDKTFKVLFTVKKSQGMVKIKPFKALWEYKENISNIYIDPTLKTILGDTLIEQLKLASKTSNSIENSADKDMGNLSEETEKMLYEYNFGQGTRLSCEEILTDVQKDEYDINKVSYSSTSGKTVATRFKEQEKSKWQVKQNRYKRLQEQLLNICDEIKKDENLLFSLESF
jgi:hypothetical protein